MNPPGTPTLRQVRRAAAGFNQSPEPSLARSVSLSRFMSQVDGGSDFFVRHHSRREKKQLHLVNSVRYTGSKFCPSLYVLFGAQKARHSSHCAGVVLLLL